MSLKNSNLKLTQLAVEKLHASIFYTYSILNISLIESARKKAKGKSQETHAHKHKPLGFCPGQTN